MGALMQDAGLGQLYQVVSLTGIMAKQHLLWWNLMELGANVSGGINKIILMNFELHQTSVQCTRNKCWKPKIAEPQPLNMTHQGCTHNPSSPTFNLTLHLR